FFLFPLDVGLPYLPSFPTRRSSDLTFFNADHLIGSNVFERLHMSARPADFKPVHLCDLSKSEVDAQIVLGSPTPSASYLINLVRSEEHTSELQSRFDLVCRLLLEKK